MPSLASYVPGPNPEDIDVTYGYNQLLEIIIANDVEALDEYLDKYNPQNTEAPWRILRDSERLRYRGNRFWEALRYGSVDVYHRLVVY